MHQTPIFCAQTLNVGPSRFQASSMDDLLAHLKAINDPACAHPQMSYMDYMAEQYTYGTAKGLHNMPDEFANEVLGSYCEALINLFHGRPFTKADTKDLKPAAANDFKHIIRGLLALDDADWRPVALVVMVKAEESRRMTVEVSNQLWTYITSLYGIVYGFKLDLQCHMPTCGFISCTGCTVTTKTMPMIAPSMLMHIDAC